MKKKCLAIIPARGGSKGIPRKNVKDLGGKPLIAWTIEAALNADVFDRIIVSTDDEEIAAVAKKWGAEVPFMRPANLATDTASGLAPVLHALDTLPGYDYVMLLQPTSPLRSVEDIRNSLKFFSAHGGKCCVSVSEAASHPTHCFTLGTDEALVPVMPALKADTRRQDLPKVYCLNGAIYIADTSWLVESKKFLTPITKAYEMPAERSIDIDTDLDFKIAEFLLNYKYD